MTDETQEINFQSVDGTPLTPELIRRSVTEVFECVRCQRKFTAKDAKSSGGLCYLDSAGYDATAACGRCLKRKRNATMLLFQAKLEREIRAEKIRETARWN